MRVSRKRLEREWANRPESTLMFFKRKYGVRVLRYHCDRVLNPKLNKLK